MRKNLFIISIVSLLLLPVLSLGEYGKMESQRDRAVRKLIRLTGGDKIREQVQTQLMQELLKSQTKLNQNQKTRIIQALKNESIHLNTFGDRCRIDWGVRRSL